jgi:hypothetical protein
MTISPQQGRKGRRSPCGTLPAEQANYIRKQALGVEGMEGFYMLFPGRVARPGEISPDARRPRPAVSGIVPMPGKKKGISQACKVDPIGAGGRQSGVQSGKGPVSRNEIRNDRKPTGILVHRHSGGRLRRYVPRFPPRDDPEQARDKEFPAAGNSCLSIPPMRRLAPHANIAGNRIPKILFRRSRPTRPACAASLLRFTSVWEEY